VDEVYSFTDRVCGPLDFAVQCYFIDPVDVSKVLLFKNEVGAQDNLSRFNVRSRLPVPNDVFTSRHYFIVNQYTISKDAFEYWEKVDIVSDQSGSLFDVQPAKIGGNIIERNNEQAIVLGYFEVSGQSVLRTFITPREIKPFHSVFNCNDFRFFRDHQAECCNCWEKSDIQIDRPEYWDD
jgi:hypothetical protein